MQQPGGVRRGAGSGKTASALLAIQALTAACTGMVAGPEVRTATPVPASRDSAYVRARRALQTESFTMDVVDSSGGHLTGTRYPSGDAKLGSGAKCRVAIAVDVRGTDREAEVAATSRWLSPDAMLDQAPDVCEQERIDVLDRIAQLLAPPQPQ